jgi:hypothetical protein
MEGEVFRFPLVVGRGDIPVGFPTSAQIFGKGTETMGTYWKMGRAVSCQSTVHHCFTALLRNVSPLTVHSCQNGVSARSTL